MLTANWARRNKPATGMSVAGEPVGESEITLFHGRSINDACFEIIKRRALKRDARAAREGEQTFPRPEAGEQA